MKILFMAAGRGERYRKEGFTISKPLIRYKDKAMIEHVIAQFGGLVHLDDMIVVGTKEVCEHVEIRYGKGLLTVPVLQTQNGPGMSALLAGGFIDPFEEVILVDSDSIVGDEAAESMVNSVGSSVLVRDHDGLTTAFSTVSTGIEDKVEDIQEKTGHSYTICVGMYKFESWKKFVKSVCSLASIRDTEIFLSAVMKDRLLRGDVVRAVSVNPEDWINLGTPKDLTEAERI